MHSRTAESFSTKYVLTNEQEQSGIIQASDFRASESSVNDALTFINKHNLTNKNEPTLASTQMNESSYQDTNPLQSDYRAAMIQNATRSVVNHLLESDLTNNPSYVNDNEQVAYELSVNNLELATQKARKIVRKHTRMPASTANPRNSRKRSHDMNTPSSNNITEYI